VQIPFMNTPMYAGPVPKYLDGADLSWVVGLLLTSPVYYWLASRDTVYRRRQNGAQVASGASR
jgi:NCS1 family nucleobase:cation symporter-1